MALTTQRNLAGCSTFYGGRNFNSAQASFRPHPYPASIALKRSATMACEVLPAARQTRIAVGTTCALLDVDC
jgi:hypothetical protein